MQSGDQVLANTIEFIFSPLYQLAVACASIYFLYGVFMFLWQVKNPEGGDTQKRNEGKSHMLWGLVGMFIILSVGGIIKLANDSIGGVFQF